MRSTILVVPVLASLTGCEPSKPAEAPAPSAFLVSGEARGGVGDGPKSVVGVTGSVAYRPGTCCTVEVYVGRSYFGPDGRSKDAERQDRELTDIGLGFATVIPETSDRLRFRLRGGRTGAPPDNQDLMRRGLSGDVALLIRLSPEVQVPVGSSVPRFDILVGGQGWALGRRESSAGAAGHPETAVAITAGVQISVEHGVDLR